MPNVRRYLVLDIDSQWLFKHLIRILASTNATAKSVTRGFINAEHGSYTAYILRILKSETIRKD